MFISDGFALRAPRHEAQIADHVSVEIERPIHPHQGLQGCELVNVSRQGCQIRSPAPAGKNERVVIRVRINDQPPMMEAAAVVRWQGQEGIADGWLIGCQFDCHLSWETLGELFLTAVLSPEAAR